MLFIVTIGRVSITSSVLKDAPKNRIDDKERTPNILGGKARDQTARKKQEPLAIQNGLPDIDKSEILKISKAGNIVSMNQYTLMQIRGTRPEALFCGKWDKRLLGVRERRIFLDVNFALFRAVVYYLNNQKYHVS